MTYRRKFRLKCKCIFSTIQQQLCADIYLGSDFEKSVDELYIRNEGD